MKYTLPMPRRDFLGGLSATIPLSGAEDVVSSGRSDSHDSPAGSDATGSNNSAGDAIRDARSYLFDSRRGDNYLHWDTTVDGTGEYGSIRQTIYFALLLQRVDRRPEAREQCLSYLLDVRSDGGGWDDPVTNYGVLLLFDLMDGDEYASVEQEVRAEIESEGHRLVPEVAPDEAADTGRTYDIRLMYAALSDEHSYDELFPRNSPLEIGRLLSYTDAFDGETISAAENIIRDPFIAVMSSNFLIGAAAYDGTLADRDQKLQEVLETVVKSRRLTNGAWGTSTVTVLSTFGLLERGYEPTDEEIRYPVDWIADNRLTEEGRVEIWRLPVWDTALTIDALLESGLRTDDSRLTEAAQWLYRARKPQQTANPIGMKLDRPPAPFRTHHGKGWGYTSHIYSDWDDTAVALDALSEFVGPALDEHVQYLRDVQNADGSWSTFATDYDPLDDAVAERVKPRIDDGLYRRFFGRNRSPDVTGGVLSVLAKHGSTVETDEDVRDAVAYLEQTKAENDMWAAIWGQAFTYGTARVLKGLRAVGVDEDRPLVADAAEALQTRQNDDGGWGEVSSYAPASSSPLDVPYESAESTPTQTAWALQALLAAGVSTTDPAIERGVEYLLETQRSDGSWPVQRVMYNWGGLNYSTVATTQAAALKALGMYQRAD